MKKRFFSVVWLILFLCMVGTSTTFVGCGGPGSEDENPKEQVDKDASADSGTPDNNGTNDTDNDGGTEVTPKDEAPKDEPPKDEPPKDEPPKDEPPKAAFTLQLLHASDHESDLGALTDAPYMSSILKALKKRYPDNTLILSSGDSWLPGPFYSASDDKAMEALLGRVGKGRADIMMVNAMGFQAAAFGNHEFDEGTGAIASLLKVDSKDGKTYPGAKFPYLSANLDFSADRSLKDLVTTDGQEASKIEGKIAKSAIILVKGEKIGIVGATTPTLAKISSPGAVKILPVDDKDIDALAAEIQKSVDALTKQGINKIIVLAHMQQLSIETKLATKLKDVDVIVAGGSDSILADSNDRLRAGDKKVGEYPIWASSASGAPVAIVNTDGQYRYVGRLLVGFDDKGVLIKSSVTEKDSGAIACDKKSVETWGNEPPNAEVVKIVEELKKVISAKDGNVFGRTTIYINGLRQFVRSEETNLGNLTADANLFVAKQADPSTTISLKNGGGIRDSIGIIVAEPGATDKAKRLPPPANPLAKKAEGGISQLNIEGVLKFNNKLVLITLTAEQLKQVVEHAVKDWAPGATPGKFPQIGGFQFSFDPSKAAGSRVQSLAVTKTDGTIDLVVKGGSIEGDAKRTFRCVTLSFLADGGDGYPYKGFDQTALKRINLVDSLKGKAGQATFTDPGSEQDALAEYLKATYDSQAYALQDTPIEKDERIQNLSKRKDTIVP